MAATYQRKRGRARRPDVLQKPRGVIHPRVQKVGSEHFGVVAVDCAKARSKWMLADFYGNVLVPPTLVEHDRAGFSRPPSPAPPSPAPASTWCMGRHQNENQRVRV